MKEYVLDPDALADLGIRTVIVATPDLQGRLVGRRVPVERFATVIDDGVDVCTSVYGWDIAQGLELIESDALPLTGLHNGLPDVTLRVDLATLRRAAWLDGVAVCFADPHDPKTGAPLSLSPRVILKQELARQAGLGFRPKVGTELEFYMFVNNPRELRDSGFRDLVPTTATSADFLIEQGNFYEPFFQQLRTDLAASGIEIEATQSELGTGQWELTFAYGDPLEMADRHALYKMAVRDSAALAGMAVTFMARPLNGQPGSSCHVHLSLVADRGDRLFWDDDADDHMSATMRHALAGVLQHAPEFLAWYAPTINSWRRVVSGDVGGGGRSWGYDNRTVMARVLGHRPQHLRFEFRLPGADTNPYLTLTGVLASARDGIVSAVPLGLPTAGNGLSLPRDDEMPSDLRGAAARFSDSTLAREIIGDANVQHMKTLLDHEWRVFTAQTSSWDLERYFDRI